jgi:hypothetical protein
LNFSRTVVVVLLVGSIAIAGRLYFASHSAQDVHSSSRGLPTQIDTPLSAEAHVIDDRLIGGNKTAQDEAAPVSAPLTRTAWALQLMAKYPDRPPHPAFVETERGFASEVVDSLWSSQMENEILGQIANINRGQLVTLAVECRTRTCRIEVLERALSDVGRPEERAPIFGELIERLGLGSPKASLFENGTATSLGYLERSATAVDPPLR